MTQTTIPITGNKSLLIRLKHGLSQFLLLLGIIYLKAIQWNRLVNAANCHILKTQLLSSIVILIRLYGHSNQFCSSFPVVVNSAYTDTE